MAERTAAFAILASVGSSVALLGLSMSHYPGGTFCDRSRPGHAFWGNFLCDLAWETSLGGGANRVGARLAEIAMVVLALGIGLFFFTAPVLFRSRVRAARLVRGLGVGSVAVMIAVAVFPSERVGDFHGLLVFAAGAPALTASILVIAALLRTEPRPRVCAAIGSAAVVAALVDLAMYGWHFLHRSECAPLLPAVQKLALGLLLAWMTLVAGRTLRLATRSA
jgi:hypothetical protein